jgi:hypothetical protein
MNTLIIDCNPFPLAKGTYQRSLLEGNARWSGADLKGTARKFASHYARSRRNLIERLETHGFVVEIRRGKHGRLSVVIREVD